MRIKYTIVCLIVWASTVTAQNQNFVLKAPDSPTDTHTYIGRDYVRFLPGYHFSATDNGKTMNAKIQQGLTTGNLEIFLAAANPTPGSPEGIAAIDKNKAVGQIPISSSVSPTGAKCYNVPIEIVPGRQGLQPDISLSYNSQAGNGIMGMGWSLNGISSIERVNKNVFFDGKNDIPAFTKSDAFALDGVKLIKTSETTSQIDYKTVIGNIIVIGTINNNDINSFKVLFPNGNIGTYGVDSHQLTYPINTLKDKNGYEIYYNYYRSPYYDYEYNSEYTSDNKNVYIIASIVYNTDLADRIDGAYCSNCGDSRIDFLYETRNDDIHYTSFKYLSRRLSKIILWAHGDSVRSYKFSYSNLDTRYLNNNTDVSHLNQINSFAKSAKLNPIKFFYGDNTSSNVSVSTITFTGADFDMTKNNIIRGKFIEDSNSDGIIVLPKKDIYKKDNMGWYSCVYPSSEQIKIYPNVQNNNLSISLTAGAGFEGIFVGSFDGKNQDHIVKVNSRLDFYLGTPVEFLTFNHYIVKKDYSLELLTSYDIPFENTVNNGNSVTPYAYFTGNFTGNGKTELLIISSDNSIRNETGLYDIDNGCRNLWTQDNFINLNIEKAIPVDVDGDGQTEFVKACWNNSNYIYKYTNGNGFTPIVSGGWNSPNSSIYYQDVNFFDLNSDGILDVISKSSTSNQIMCLDNNGRQLHENPIYDSNTQYKYSIHAINGDNTPYLIVQNAGTTNTTIYTYNYSTESFNNTYFTTNEPLQNFGFIDYDINSNHNYSSLLALGSNQIKIFSFSQNHAQNGMVSLMVNSLGIADKTDYSQLSQGTNYTVGNSAIFPFSDYSGSMWLTKQTSTMYDKQIINSSTYSYSGAILHKQGLGLCGFSSVNTTDLMTNKNLLVEFDPYHSGVITHQLSDIEESNFTYDFTSWNNISTNPLLTYKTITDKLKGNALTVTCSDYDSYGNAKTVVSNFGGGITSTVTNTFDNRIGDVNLIGLLTSKVTTNVRGGNTFSQTEEYVYPADNRLHFARKYVGATIVPASMIAETEYKYNSYFGTVSDEIVHNIPTGDYLTTSYTYDTDNAMLKTKTDPHGLTTTYTNDLSKRLVMGVADYKGNTVSYLYDDWRRKNTETSTIGSSTITTTADLQWNTGQDIKKLIKLTQTTTGQPKTTVYSDAFGRETQKKIVGFDGSDVFVNKEYDLYGRLRSSSAPYKSNESPLLTTYTYDEYSRPQNVIQPSGSTTSYGYSGNEVSETKDGILTKKTTDATGLLVSSWDNGGTVTYTYRPDGQPDNVNAAGVITRFEYNDTYNRQTKLIDPSAGTVQTVYDDTNHKVTQIWNSGKTIETIFNRFGQPVTKTTPDFVSSYSYEDGKPKTVTSTNGTSKTITYDTQGQLWKIDETVGTKTYQEVYGYDNGRIGSVTYNTNTGINTLIYSVVNKYNTNGYLYRLEDASGNRLSETNSVNALGQETSVLLGNGLTTTKNYTPEGLITGIQTGTIQNVSYNFNRITGTLLSRTDNSNNRGLTESFTYDNLYRLKNYGSKALNYSDNGNITSKTDAGGYTYTESGKPYTLSTVTNAATDLTGQLDVTYTVMSRPTSIANTSGLTAAFTYTDDYDRATMQIKQGTAETLNKIYFGGGKYEIETAGGVEKQRLYVDGSPYTASILLEKTGSNAAQIYYLHRDYLGSITQITDNNGNLAAEYSYDAWGRMRNPVDWTPYTQSQLSQYPIPYGGRGYTGHEQLNQFGIINMNARLYDPVLGRFLAPDPYVGSGMTNDFNRYVYGRNNPLMYIDLSGKSFWTWLQRNIVDPFVREWKSVFGNGITVGVGTDFKLSSMSMTAAPNGPTGMPYGPGFGIQTNNWKTITPVYANYQGGFFSTQPVNFESNLQKSAVRAEQSAKEKYNYNQTLQNFGNQSSNFDVAAAGFEINQMALKPYVSSVSEFSDYVTLYRNTGSAGKMFSVMGTAAGVASLVVDYNSMRKGDMSETRFGYHTASFGTSLAIGASLGGVAGATAGGLFWAGEELYDHMAVPVMDWYWQLENGLRTFPQRFSFPY